MLSNGLRQRLRIERSHDLCAESAAKTFSSSYSSSNAVSGKITMLAYRLKAGGQRKYWLNLITYSMPSVLAKQHKHVDPHICKTNKFLFLDMIPPK